MTIIIFILILALLVLVHEFGHFITARKAGMRVYEFGFGFPPRALGVYKDPQTKKWMWVWGKGRAAGERVTSDGVTGNGRKAPWGPRPFTGERGTEDQFPATLYSLNWLPLGGFCKIKGENGEALSEPDSFGFHKAWKRAIVLAAGVSMNFILAAILLAVGFMVGLPADFSLGMDKKAVVVESAQIMVQNVAKASPAKSAGVMYGDKLVKINETDIVSSQQMSDYIREYGANELALTVEREGRNLTFNLTPAFFQDNQPYPQLGLVMADVGLIRYPWHIALYKGFAAAAIGAVNIVIAFYFVIKNLILGQGLIFEVAGPVGIAVMVGDSLRLGVHYLINLTAMLSLVLAVINILPIPALDGGRILFIGLEKILRRPVPMKYEQLAHTIGFVLLMGLIVVVTWRDVAGLF